MFISYRSTELYITGSILFPSFQVNYETLPNTRTKRNKMDLFTVSDAIRHLSILVGRGGGGGGGMVGKHGEIYSKCMGNVRSSKPNNLKYINILQGKDD